MCAGAAVVLITVGAGMLARADAYFSGFDFATAGAVEIDQKEFDSYNDLSVLGSNLIAVATPLLLCTVCGVVILLAVLAQRRERLPEPIAEFDQADATAAS